LLRYLGRPYKVYKEGLEAYRECDSSKIPY
jgi:hypothetical protein